MGKTTRIILLLVGITVFRPVHATDCISPVLAQADAEFQVLLEEELARVVMAVKSRCSSVENCSTEEWKNSLLTAIEEHGKKHQSVLRSLLLLPRRMLVFTTYIASVLVPTVTSVYLAEKLQIPPKYFGAVAASVASISGFLLGRSGMALEKMFGPYLEQATLVVWDPGDDDSWGEIQKLLNDKFRFVSSQIYNQLIVFDQNVARAGDAVSAGNLELAAKQYASALVLSQYLFKGLHYYKEETLTKVRSFLPELEKIPFEQKVELVVRVCERLARLRPDELKSDITRQDLVRFGFGVMLVWLVGPPKATLEPVVAPTSASAYSEIKVAEAAEVLPPEHDSYGTALREVFEY